MANNYESEINEMFNELNGLKESSVDAMVSPLSKTQVNVLSTSLDKIVIQINLNENTENNGSSVDDKNEEYGNDSDDNEETDDKTIKRSVSDSYLGGQSTGNKSQMSEESPFRTSGQQLNQLYNGRSFRRTISESSSEVTTRGILKYPHSWKRRTVSESSCDFAHLDLEFSDTFSSIEEIYSEDEFDSENKSKKNVRFSDNVSRTIFRPNSSILGRKLKNKKRAQKKKNSKHNCDLPVSHNNSSEQLNKADSVDNQRLRQDSGYDSEDIGHEDMKLDYKAHKQNNRIQIETGINSQSIE